MSNQLETDSAELKSYISKFFADKANEFTAQMKTHMDSLVEKKITRYYDDSNTEPFQDFVVGITDTYNHQYIFSINSYIVKTDGSPYRHTIKHNLTPPMLQSIKIIFNGTGLHTLHWAEPTHNIFKKMIENPKYFMTNCTEFEETCRKEYALIKEQKQELERLIEEEVENREYYSELEKKIEQVESKERVIQQERQKIQEERSRLFAVKQKLDLMKRELDMERDEFEKEKRKHEIKNIDLDDYFEIPVATVVATKVSPTVGETILGEFSDL